MSRPGIDPPSDHGCVAGGDDGDAPVSCHGVRTWAGPGPRLSVVTRTRGRSHPHTPLHYGKLIVMRQTFILGAEISSSVETFGLHVNVKEA